MNVLSIQSHVAFGHVGNSAATFPLQRLGFEVWPVDTVQFSNHKGYGDWRGQVFTAAQVAELLDGLERRGAFGICDALLTGYLGDRALGAVILDTLTRVREANPKALYLCDPVMGDEAPGLYVHSDIPAFMREKMVPCADIVTPNSFELALLSGMPAGTIEEAIAASRKLLSLGPKTVVVTSLRGEDLDEGKISMLAVTGEGVWQVTTPFLAMDPAPNGAGDSVAALLLAEFLKGASAKSALTKAASAIFAVLEETARVKSRELCIIAAQDRMVNPATVFEAKRLS